jgi:hypothetical protein
MSLTDLSSVLWRLRELLELLLFKLEEEQLLLLPGGPAGLPTPPARWSWSSTRSGRRS